MENQTPTTTPTPRQDRLREIGKLKSWQVLLAILFVFLLLPSLVTPPSILIAWTILCSVLVYRWWVTRIVARRMLQNAETGQNRSIYWASMWSVAWRSFLICALLPSLLLIFIAPTPEAGGAGTGVALVTWLLSLLLSLDVPIWTEQSFNPSAVTAGVTGVLGLIISATPLGVFVAVPAVVAGAAARKQLRSPESFERGKRLALAGLILGAVVLVLYLSMMLYLSVSGQFSSAESTRPLPPTRTAEMQQRVEAYAKRSGDAGMAEVVDSNLEMLKRLEDHSGKMVEAYERLDPEAIFDPASAGAETVEEQIKAVNNLQAVALQYKDTVILFRQKIATDAAEKYAGQPEAIQESLENSRAGMQLAAQWSDTAIAFADAARRLLQSYQDTSFVDQGLLQATAVRAEEYDDAQVKVVERMMSNFEQAEKQMPR